VISDVCSWSSAGHFIVCPTYYSDDPVLAKLFGVTPQSYLHDLGRLVDPLIDIFWTGEKVISDRYSEVHLADVAHRIGRKPFIWDNHIANDSRIRSNFLFLDPSAGGWELPADRAAGLAVNPMNQPCLSRIALMGYQSLLCANRNDLLPNVCRLLCGSSFAQLLLEDAHVLQNVGFAGLDSKEFARLLDRYSSRGTDPYAREIASWLSGEYAFDPQCLTE
jgi:hyaluronoglucosaminidase